MKIKRKIIEIDESLCDGCGDCVTACAEGAIQVVNGKAKVVNEVFCDGLGACIGDCPTGALKLIEREAEPFDEEAVKEHLATFREQPDLPDFRALAGGCPSSQLQQFSEPASCQMANQPRQTGSRTSALSQWPIQIKLIPPTAPFLNQADLLIAADCVPAACPDFHDRFLRNKVLMLGCPKLDDVQDYIEKFAAIFQTATVKSVTVVVMEVPCCSGLPMILKRSMQLAGVEIPFEEITINIQEGKVIQTLKN